MITKKLACLFLLITSTALSAHAENVSSNPIPAEIQAIFNQDKYAHSLWGLYVKDPKSDRPLYDLNSNKMFLPGSTSKIFTTAALLNAYGDDFRFITPVYAIGSIADGVLNGNLVLVGKGDLTFGGRQSTPDTIEFTAMDHVYANALPGTVLTKQNPLEAIDALAQQISNQGIKKINGDIVIDERLFNTFVERDAHISPLMINENLIDVTINPSKAGEKALVAYRPEVEGYSVTNEIITAPAGEKLDIELVADDENRHFIVRGKIPLGEKDIVRTFPIANPSHFAKVAFIQALKAHGVTVNPSTGDNQLLTLPSQEELEKIHPIAIWKSPPLIEYVKLILKVSHNTGANLAAMLLAVKNHQKTFDEGLVALGKFVADTVGINKSEFVFTDGAGGDGNRLTLQAVVKMLKFMKQKPVQQFQKFMEAMPILGVDGSLENVSTKSVAKGKVFAKTGTGVAYNPALEQFFLNTQALAGYIKANDGSIWEFSTAVNNAEMPKIDDIFPIFEDFGKISTAIYEALGK